MIHEGNNVVLLISTTYEEDSGDFTCRATNAAGQVESTAKLIVQSKDWTELLACAAPLLKHPPLPTPI